VVAIGTVFCLQLPVAVIGVGGRTTQYFQALWGLVNEHVQDGAGVTQVLIEFHDIWVQRTKEEAAVAFESVGRDAGHGCHRCGSFLGIHHLPGP